VKSSLNVLPAPRLTVPSSETGAVLVPALPPLNFSTVAPVASESPERLEVWVPVPASMVAVAPAPRTIARVKFSGL